MADAVSITTTTLKSQIRYEIRDINSTQYTDAELLVYINKCLEIAYEELVNQKSELVRTGSGTITTVAGTQSYDLSANDMGDLWIPHRVWISEYEPMEMCEEKDLYDAINANEGSTTSRTIPDEYCIIGDYIWFKDYPDDAYTVNIRYFPNFVPLSSGGTMPYKNLFNQEVVEGVKFLAKHRNEKAIGVDATLKDIFHDRAMQLVYRRRAKSIGFHPRIK